MLAQDCNREDPQRREGRGARSSATGLCTFHFSALDKHSERVDGLGTFVRRKRRESDIG